MYLNFKNWIAVSYLIWSLKTKRRIYQSIDLLFRKSSPVEGKLNQKAKHILEAFWNLQAYLFKQVQILQKQAGQMLEISNAHKKYETNNIFIPKERLSSKKVLRQSVFLQN